MPGLKEMLKSGTQSLLKSWTRGFLISWTLVLLTFIVLCLKDQMLLFRRLCTLATDANLCHTDANHCLSA